jgi:membrane protease YdiL (CAAX protease family)
LNDPADPPRHSWGLGDAVGGIAASIVVPVLVAGVAGVTPDEIDRAPIWELVVLQLPFWLTIFGTVVLASRRKGTGSLRRDFGLEMRGRDVLIGLALGVLAQLVLTLALIPIYHLVGIDPDDAGRAAQDLADRASNAFDWAWLFVLVVAGAPFFEELFHRGLVLRAARARWGDAAAIVVSGLVFGALHFDPAAFLALSLFGFLLGWLAVRTGRLGPGIWTHVAFNLTTFIALVLAR